MAQPSVKLVLSIPRAGTHFIWSRCIASGDYQLMYDTDRIAALSILADVCDEKLDFLYPCPPSPNYNFQYNSLVNTTCSMTAWEHLDFLKKKYNATDEFDLFCRSLYRQDNKNKQLLIVNRFVYTCSYRFLFKNFIWKIDHALEALRLMIMWFERAGIHIDSSMVIRQNPQWVKSYVKMSGQNELSFVAHLLQETPRVLDFCLDRSIPIFWMKDVIQTMSEGCYSYEKNLPSLDREILMPHWYQTQAYEDSLSSLDSRPTMFRWDRFSEYVNEKDPIKRTSLVRSIGQIPLSLANKIPIGFGKKILEDLSSSALNNAAIDLDNAHDADQELINRRV